MEGINHHQVLALNGGRNRPPVAPVIFDSELLNFRIPIDLEGLKVIAV